MGSNPIPFNPELMTVKQLKRCAEALRALFDGLEREVDAANIIHHLRQWRDQMQREAGQ